MTKRDADSDTGQRKGGRRTGERPDDAEQIMIKRLDHAVEREEFSLVYQYQIDGADRLVGVECLLRWDHPEAGQVSPGVFVPLAERTGRIRPITRWVLGQALAETRDFSGLNVGVNASALEFADPDFAHEVAAAVETARYDPARLEIEVTETAILADADVVHQNMNRLHDLGVKIALDDFGAGYSSLNHLRLFPFDKLKIDQAFIANCTNTEPSATLIHALVEIGRALGMSIVAEGVETPEQQAFLRQAGVHAMQGHLFGEAVTAAALRTRLTLSPPIPRPS